MIKARKVFPNRIFVAFVAFVLTLCLSMILFPTVASAIAEPNSPTTAIRTPRGNIVNYAYIVSGEFTTTLINELNAYMDELYPNSQRIRSASGKYNCHSYAWYSTSTGNSIWISYPDSYTSDGSYTIIATGSSAQSPPSSVPNGSKVHYVGDNHSAIKTSAASFTSKWGDFGLYVHTPPRRPYFGTLIYYN